MESHTAQIVARLRSRGPPILACQQVVDARDEVRKLAMLALAQQPLMTNHLQVRPQLPEDFRDSRAVNVVSALRFIPLLVIRRLQFPPPKPTIQDLH